MSTLSLTRVGLIDPQQSLQQKFVQRFLDYKRHTESVVVHELYKEGNLALAVMMNNTVDTIINEQMHLKLLS